MYLQVAFVAVSFNYREMNFLCRLHGKMHFQLSGIYSYFVPLSLNTWPESLYCCFNIWCSVLGMGGAS